MIGNCSLLFLNILSFSNSPVIANNPNTLSLTFKFQHITAKNIFNNFFYLNSINSKQNWLSIQQSIFSNSLNSAIFLDFDGNYTNSSQIFTEQQVLNKPGRWYVTLSNCCFSRCTSTSAHPYGGAIVNLITYSLLTLTSCIFTNCHTDSYGGAIMSDGQNSVIQSTIFAGCQAEFGMALYFTRFRADIYNVQTLSLDQVSFAGNSGKYSVNDINASQVDCVNANFTDNVAQAHIPASSQMQSCCVFPFLAPSWNENFKFVNMLRNRCDVLVDFNEKPNSFIVYLNIIQNEVRNYFFHFDIMIYGGYEAEEIHVQNANFFNNKAADGTSKISVANPTTQVTFYLENCVFDGAESDVNDAMNMHVVSGGRFMATLGPGVTHPMGAFVSPSICKVEIVSGADSSVFTESKAFSESLKFTKSEIYSKSSMFTSSGRFSPLSHFSPSSKFTSSLHFTSSSPFTSSSEFSPSRGQKMHASPSSPFTPSDHFTPSRSFSPARTRVPDPQDIFNRADIYGRRKDLFTKEELKKAAAPASISIVLIIVAVVMTIYYLNRRIKQLRNQGCVPEFDTSFSDDAETDTDYSYSYYTYESYYAYSGSYQSAREFYEAAESEYSSFSCDFDYKSNVNE